MKQYIFFAILSFILGTYAEKQVNFLIEKQDKGYLRHGNFKNQQITQISNNAQQNIGLLALGVPTSLNAETAFEVAQIINPDPFNQPQAYFKLRVYGKFEGEEIVKFLNQEKSQKNQYIASESQVSYHGQPEKFIKDSKITPVDLNNKKVADQEWQNKDVLELFANQKKLRLCDNGTLSLDDGTQFDLHNEALKGVFTEIAIVSKNIGNIGSNNDKGLLYLIIGKLIKMGHLKGSDLTNQQQKSLQTFQLDLISQWINLLQGGFEDRIIAQIDFVPHAPTLQQRSMLQTTANSTNLPSNYGVTPDDFSTFSTAICVFLIILYFIIAAMYCMCSMKQEKDSLLYARQKAE